MMRADLQKVLGAVWAQSRRSGRGFGVLLFSVDRFRLLNNRFGYDHADAVLGCVTAAARHALRRRGILGRWGGDEFLCILPRADPATSNDIAEDLRQAIERLAIPVGVRIANVTASFGVACYPEHGHEVRMVLGAADEALYQAKRAGRNRIGLASSPDQRFFAIGDILETALREDRVMPAYQPICDLDTGARVAEEALARIITTDERVILAQDFIDFASTFHLTHKIDRTIALCALRRCGAAIAHDEPLTVFINLSGDLLRHPPVLKELLDAATAYCGLSGGRRREQRVVIEITERELLDHPRTVQRQLAPFLDLGLRLALDDFGSGYSSFQYLADLPVSYLKIDGRLIERLDEPKVQSIVRGIQNTAQDLGLITLAEYVQEAGQAQRLREIGVDWGQGHYFSQATLDEHEADARRRMSVNWAGGYYYRKPAI